ncbi:DUF4365 domain-containing protein [uncultured Cohaesibacter sp.]|uniref:DUF4365 domain-containing protein n=1 Tax=uncultured Cohaesibacter sp. TaxID=1002546 RepID=UPI0029C8826C|nr:DUF4365 domain-containing protein [uncultured Cohaesibacter sp.]
MGLTNQRQGQIGVNVVERIVLAEWGARWQPLEAHNDDAIDGLIFLEKGGELSGQIVFVQIKCLAAPLRNSGKYAIPINAPNLARNLGAWRKVVGAAIVVLVDPETLVARWTDIRPEATRTSSQIYVPSNNLFNKAAKHVISGLCGTLHQDLQAQKVHTFAEDFPHLRCRDHIQRSSRQVYKSLQNVPTRLGGNGEQVHFDREGWRHITRPDRSQLTRYQSFVLLGAVRKIIESYNVRLIDSSKPLSNMLDVSFMQIDSMVSFPFRQTGLIRLVLKCVNVGSNDSPKLKFWTVYEPRRKLNGMGVQEPRRP